MIEIKYFEGCDVLAGLSEEYFMWQWGQMVWHWQGWHSHCIFSLLSQPAEQSTMF